jgi:hypothetical protein
VVSTPPLPFSTAFNAIGVVSTPPLPFLTTFQRDWGGLNTTPLVFDGFQCDPHFRHLSTRSGWFQHHLSRFRHLSTRSGWFQHHPAFNAIGGVSTPPLFRHGFNAIGVVSTPPHPFLTTFQCDWGGLNTTPLVFDGNPHFRHLSTRTGWFQPVFDS